MSGICGLVIREGGIDRMTGTLQAMLEALASPAPGEEFLLNQGKAGLAARGFPGRRAGVAGIRAGNGSVGLAFHGSLYNLRDLVAAESRAPDASGALLRLYLAEGIGFLTRFRGEFVLAVWDQREDSLYLATDRFRVHPLFYHASRDRLLFSSRLAGLYQTPSSPGRTVDPEAVVDLLAFSAIPTPKTIFREARKLPPGHLLTYRAGEARLERYWDLDFREPSVAGRKALGARLKSIFAEAVFIRLASEEDSNRVGCFLSGGVDSSTVAGVLTELRQGPVKSFSIGFDEPRFNEMAYARIAARAFGAQHHEYVVTARDTCEAIPILLDAFDEPYANASAVPTYFCARLMRESGVDAAYAGDGGDELFAGNERYAAHRIFDYYGRIPPWMRRALIEPVVFSLHRYLGWTLLDKGRKYIQRANIPRARRITSYGFFNVVAARDLLNGDLLESLGGDYDPYGAVASFYDGAPAATELDRELYLDLHLAISDNDLFKVTRMTEAAGLAVRYPFLDHLLAEFAARVPARLKMRGRKLRTFFKEAYADLLPRATRAKTKHGFGLPIPIWLKTHAPLRDMMHDLLFSSTSLERGYFRKEALERMVAHHLRDRTSFYGTALWNLMMLELWQRRFSGALRKAKSDPGQERPGLASMTTVR